MSFSSLFCGRVNRECPNLNEVKGKVVPEPERSEEEGCPAEENLVCLLYPAVTKYINPKLNIYFIYR
jgi:hypothetical protein